MKGALKQEVAQLLQEQHTVGWMKDVMDEALAELARSRQDVSMNDVVSAFVCVVLREKEHFRTEFAIRI